MLASDLEEAVAIAPWWANGYFKLGIINEMASHREHAVEYLVFYLRAAPEAPDRQEVEERVDRIIRRTN